jgi:hypothetical protein
MYALRLGVDGLSAGTRVNVLSNPTIDPVHVRTLTKVPKCVHRAWFDQDGQQHHETITVSESFVELRVPHDCLVKLRRHG